MKRQALLAAAALAVSVQPVIASPASDRTAYEAALKCYVVSGAASGERHDAGDQAGADAYEAKARLAFNAAVKLGGRLGMSNRTIDQDFSLTEIRELPKITRDAAYNRNAAATCRALGLY